MNFKFRDYEFYLDTKNIKLGTLFIAVSGSHPYGWGTPRADLDIRKVWIPDINQALSIEYRGNVKETKMPLDDGRVIDLVDIPLYRFLGTLSRKGNGNYLENLFQEKLWCMDKEVKEVQEIVMKNLHTGFLDHYLGYYYKSLKPDMLNPSRLVKYGLQKLILMSYRVLRSGLILGEKRVVVYNLLEQDKYIESNICLQVRQEYLNGKPTRPKLLLKAKKELDELHLLLKETKKNCGWYEVFPDHLFDRWLKKYYIGE